MSGSEEKKLNSLHEEDSLYKAQGGKAAYQISPTYGQNTLYKVNPVHDAWDRALAAESICQDILSSARNQLYLNMRFMGLRIVSTFLSGRYGRSSCWNGWNCPVLSAGRTDGTVQEKPGKGESNLSSQPFTLHFSPLFSREG